jgi:hypothetical protein
MLAALAALAASLCLVGCSVDATVEVTADDMVSVDVTAWYAYGRDIPRLDEPDAADFDPCGDLRAVKGLVVTRTENSADNAMSCHAVGRGQLASMSFNDLAIIHAGDRYVAILGPGLAQMFTSGYQFEGLMVRPSTIRLRLPGMIEAK